MIPVIVFLSLCLLSCSAFRPVFQRKVCVSQIYNSISEYESIKDIAITSSKDGNKNTVSNLWKDDETAALICFRSFGWVFCQELAAQIASEVIPLFEQQETPTKAKLICIGIGTHERSLEFCNHTGFPREYLYSDEDNFMYTALSLVKSTPANLFTDIRTPLALAKRFSDGKAGYLGKAVQNWAGHMWIPPKLEQGLQQGGSFVFKGKETIFSYRDPSAGAHVDLNAVVQTALLSGGSSANRD